jgi:hypothetical protein
MRWSPVIGACNVVPRQKKKTGFQRIGNPLIFTVGHPSMIFIDGYPSMIFIDGPSMNSLMDIHQ